VELKRQRDELLEALKELVDIVDNSSHDDIDSFTTQPGRAAIANCEAD
jgi:hypothetical protein